MPATSPAPLPPLPAWKAALYVVGATACFHAAYLTPFGVLIFGYVACLTQLVRVATVRLAFYVALLTALLCVAPQSTFFYGILGPFGIVLWIVLAFWTALYIALAHHICRRLSRWLPFGWRRRSGWGWNTSAANSTICASPG